MQDLAIGIASGLGASTGAEILHSEPDQKNTNHLLTELQDTLHTLHGTMLELCNYLKNTQANTIEEHVTQYIYNNIATPLRKQKGMKIWLGLYVLVASASTFTVTISGLGSFTWTPVVGSYNRWKFPDGSTIQLVTPAQPSYPIDLLYTDDLTNN